MLYPFGELKGIAYTGISINLGFRTFIYTLFNLVRYVLFSTQLPRMPPYAPYAPAYTVLSCAAATGYPTESPESKA